MYVANIIVAGWISIVSMTNPQLSAHHFFRCLRSDGHDPTCGLPMALHRIALSSGIAEADPVFSHLYRSTHL